MGEALFGDATWGGVFFVYDPVAEGASSTVRISGEQNPSLVNIHAIFGRGRKFGFVGLWVRGVSGERLPAGMMSDGSLSWYDSEVKK